MSADPSNSAALGPENLKIADERRAERIRNQKPETRNLGHVMVMPRLQVPLPAAFAAVTV